MTIMKLIDKDALVAKIKKLREIYSKCIIRDNYEDGLKNGRMIGYEDALYEIDTCEVKEVDLEKEVDNIMKRFLGNITCREEQLNFAKHFFELGLSVSNKTQKGE